MYTLYCYCSSVRREQLSPVAHLHYQLSHFCTLSYQHCPLCLLLASCRTTVGFGTYNNHCLSHTQRHPIMGHQGRICMGNQYVAYCQNRKSSHSLQNLVVRNQDYFCYCKGTLYTLTLSRFIMCW